MNFIESQKYPLLFTKLTGLTSYEYDRKRTMLKTSKIKQAIGCVISWLILSISYFLMNNQIYIINNDIIQDGSLTSDAAIFIEICIYLFCTMLISINGFWTNKTQVQLLNRMLNFQHNNTELMQFHKRMYGATNKTLLSIFGFYAVLMSVAFGVIYYKYNILSDMYSVYIFMYHCYCHNVMICYLANIVDSLRFQLKCLNNDIQTMGNANSKILVVANLVAALELHQSICNSFKLISRAFGLVIIGVFLDTFMVTTMEVYMVLVFASKGFNSFLLFYIGTDLCWTGLYMYFLLRMFHKCSQLSEEVNSTNINTLKWFNMY